MVKTLRIGFMGTPDFARAALAALCDTRHEIVCVYSQPPRPKGRGQKMQFSAVQAFAEEQSIPTYTPLNFKDQADVEIFQGHNLDVAIVAAYGLILPQVILDAPRFGCVNIHGSLLPRWRGASPIQHAIWHGDAETGVGLMQMELGLDTGPVMMEDRLPITATTNAAALHDDLAAMGARMVAEYVDQLAANQAQLPATVQEGQSVYAPLLSKDDGRIDWSQNSTQIDQHIRGLNPSPGVWTMVGDKRLKILTASPTESITDQPAGTLLDKSGAIACGQGSILQLHMLQPEGKKPMDFASALNGGYVTVGACLA